MCMEQNILVDEVWLVEVGRKRAKLPVRAQIFSLARLAELVFAKHLVLARGRILLRLQRRERQQISAGSSGIKKAAVT